MTDLLLTLFSALPLALYVGWRIWRRPEPQIVKPTKERRQMQIRRETTGREWE